MLREPATVFPSGLLEPVLKKRGEELNFCGEMAVGGVDQKSRKRKRAVVRQNHGEFVVFDRFSRDERG